MSMPNSNPLTTLLTMLHLIKIVKIFKICVNYFIRYAGRPAMVKIESQNTIKNQRLSAGSTMIIRMKNVMMSQIM